MTHLALLVSAALLTGCATLENPPPIPVDLYCALYGSPDGSRGGWYAGCLVLFH